MWLAIGTRRRRQWSKRVGCLDVLSYSTDFAGIFGRQSVADHRRGVGLMYPRNAASPPRIAVGPVIQIADGAVQTTGASVTVAPQGGSETAGGGTLACLGTSGVWVYTPTQAETNYAAFIVSVYKTDCIPACVTVVTSAAPTAGKVMLDATDTSAATIAQVATMYTMVSAAGVFTADALANAPTGGGGGATADEVVTALMAHTIDTVALDKLLQVLLAFVAGNTNPLKKPWRREFMARDGSTVIYTLTYAKRPDRIVDSVIA